VFNGDASPQANLRALREAAAARAR
jgi:hypothetical protein